MTKIDDDVLATVIGGLSDAKKCALAVGGSAGSFGALGAWAGAPAGPLAAAAVGAMGAVDGAVSAYLVTPACQRAK
jgi:hypothetical protein